jgi:FtsH-binding integral membrane protein
MHPSAQRTAGIVAVAAAVALVLWAVARLLGVDLDVRIGGDVRQVGPADVLVTTVLAGLAAWVVHSVLARTPRTARWWPFIASTALAISMTGPSYLSDGADAVALMATHLVVGATLIYGFATSRPSWTAARKQPVSAQGERR